MLLRTKFLPRLIRLGALSTFVVASIPLACAPPAVDSAVPIATTAPPTDTAFFGEASGYVSAPVATTAAAAHLAKKVSVSMPAVPACLTCHRAGGRGSPFVFAGTAFVDKAATKGAADIEIRVVDAKGNAQTAHTDADGNFWMKGAAPLAKPARAGARNAQTARVQRASISTGDCNSCHTSEVPLVF